MAAITAVPTGFHLFQTPIYSILHAERQRIRHAEQQAAGV
jgi:hypothetical protein